jgi:cGMP-specific 3',5'-cyclic phosphodiesterase, invertebrate
MNVVESAILSTDLAMYFKKRDKFLELIDNGEFDWQSDEKKERELIVSLKRRRKNKSIPFFYFYPVLCGMMMTACDVS